MDRSYENTNCTLIIGTYYGVHNLRHNTALEWALVVLRNLSIVLMSIRCDKNINKLWIHKRYLSTRNECMSGVDLKRSSEVLANHMNLQIFASVIFCQKLIFLQNKHDPKVFCNISSLVIPLHYCKNQNVNLITYSLGPQPCTYIFVCIIVYTYDDVPMFCL